MQKWPVFMHVALKAIGKKLDYCWEYQLTPFMYQQFGGIACKVCWKKVALLTKGTQQQGANR